MLERLEYSVKWYLAKIMLYLDPFLIGLEFRVCATGLQQKLREFFRNLAADPA